LYIQLESFLPTACNVGGCGAPKTKGLNHIFCDLFSGNLGEVRRNTIEGQPTTIKTWSNFLVVCQRKIETQYEYAEVNGFWKK